MSEYDLFARLCDLEHKHLTEDIETSSYTLAMLGVAMARSWNWGAAVGASPWHWRATAWMWLALTTRRPCSTWHDSGHVKPA